MATGWMLLAVLAASLVAGATPAAAAGNPLSGLADQDDDARGRGQPAFAAQANDGGGQDGNTSVPAVQNVTTGKALYDAVLAASKEADSNKTYTVNLACGITYTMFAKGTEWRQIKWNTPFIYYEASSAQLVLQGPATCPMNQGKPVISAGGKKKGGGFDMILYFERSGAVNLSNFVVDGGGVRGCLLVDNNAAVHLHNVDLIKCGAHNTRRGPGVYIEKSRFSMQGGSIKNANIAYSVAHILIAPGKTVTFRDVNISDNSAYSSDSSTIRVETVKNTSPPSTLQEVVNCEGEAIFSCLNCTFSRNKAPSGSAVAAVNVAPNCSLTVDLTGSAFSGDTQTSRGARGWKKLWVVIGYFLPSSSLPRGPLPIFNITDGAGLRLGTIVETSKVPLSFPAMGYVYA